MIHLGDITKINGSAVEPVNVIIGGSPCQDLSIAGGRAGLAGERSGLFMEQIRLITEMRDADAARGRTGRSIRPRWMVWENVPGAFSSNKGADFAAVLHETIKIICPQAPAVSVPKHGWPTAGCLTPLECERLQGYPDGWTDIGDWTKTDKKGKSRMVSSADSLRYKALGNSIALPPWAYVLTRLSLCAAEEPTMASLFDGIGGFPLIWEWLNGKGTCLWASEIEDFPIAVTKEHFPDEDDNLIPLF